MTTTPGAVLAAPAEAEPGKYRLRPGVPILPVHERAFLAADPATGRPVLGGDGQPVRRVFRVDEATLHALADDANARAARKSFPLVLVGHTIPDEPDESKQPEPVGYLENFRVGPLLDAMNRVVDPRPHLIADEQIRADRWDDAMTYPHRSPEIRASFSDPARSRLNALALLRRQPEHEMGLVTYSSGDPVALPDDDEEEAGDEPAGDEAPAAVAGAPTDAAPAADEAPDAGEDTMALNMTPEDLQALAEALAPILAPIVQQHVNDHIDTMAGDADADEGDIQNADSPVGGDNGFVPSMVPAEPDTTVRNCDGMPPAKEDEDVKYQALERHVNARLDELTRVIQAQQDELDTQTIRYQREQYGARLDALVAKGIRLDKGQELDRLFQLPESMWDSEVERMELHYAHVPAGQGFVPEAAAPARRGPSMNREERARTRAFAQRHGITDMEVARAEMAKQGA